MLLANLFIFFLVIFVVSIAVWCEIQTRKNEEQAHALHEITKRMAENSRKFAEEMRILYGQIAEINAGAKRTSEKTIQWLVRWRKR